MTITTETTPAAADLHDLTDEDVAGLYRAADELTRAAAVRELDRRDRDDRLARTRAKGAEVYAEGERQAYANYRAADAACRGELLSRAGKAAGITDEQVLWRLPLEQAMRFASQELTDYWLYVAPRVTAREYVRQRAAERRGEYAQARDTRNMEANTDDGMAGSQTAALRHVAAAPQAPQARPGRPVHRGGPDHGGTEGGGEDGRDGRAGRPVRRDTPVTGTVAVPEAATAVGQEPRIPGGQLLDLLRDGWFGHYARFPSPAALDTVTLWAAHAHMRDENGILVFRATPRLYLLSSEPGAGKSFALELVGRVSPSWFGLDLEPTAPGLAHTISKEHATVTLDEADLAFGAGARHEAVRAIINGGTYRHGTVLNGRGAKANRVSVFGPLGLAGLDSMETGTGDKLKALWTRGVKIRMEKASGENRPPNLTKAGEDAAGKAKVWLERWAAQVRDEVADADPEIPEGIEGRAEDIWAPLLAVADAAGGSWPERARAACLELALGKPDGGENLEDEFASFADSFGALR